jgi:membrane-bound lytic murein transglycosylase D
MFDRTIDRGPRFPLAFLILLPALALAGCQSFSFGSREEAAAAPAPLPLVEPIGAGPALVPRPTIALEALPELPQDLLSRLSRSFSLPVDKVAAEEPSVGRELDWFASHQEYLDRVFGRSEPYLYYIKSELERRGMPTDLALLPVVESAYDPFAYSHGRASGLWQIIPGTGRRLGLKQNWWFDGRRDIVESTRAALDYLQALNTLFDGDWLLAVAGYNSGEGNVERAIRRAKAAGKPLDFWGIRSFLPPETRTYVPRLLAIRALVAAPGRHMITLPELANVPYFAIVETGGQIDMALAAELGEIDLDDLYALNPGVNRWATDPEGPHRLLVPEADAAPFAAALANLGERERVEWTRHQIRSGETLSTIARKYQTTEAVLRQVNDVRGSMIRAGDYLMIPHATESLASYSQSAQARAARQINRERSGERSEHVVRSGESLWSISRAYNVNVRELASWNAMAPGDVLSVGRKLVIWTKSGSGAATVLASTAVPAQDQIRKINYVVRRGDSLYSIATRFRITIAKLVEWNSLSVKKYLQPGQRLVMYVDVTEQSS